MSTAKKVGFIGVGNMGGALLRAVCGKLGGGAVCISDMDSEKTALASEKYGCEVCTVPDNAFSSSYIFLGVKPQMMADMLRGIKQVLASKAGRFVLVSMAAGLSIETIQNMSGGKYPVIRIMPNIPAAVGEGMILFAASCEVQESEIEEFRDFMELSGVLDEVKESMIDAGSAVSGCGPAFASMFIEALADGAVACGVPRKKALLYAEQTLIGTAKYLMETGMHPGELKDNVTSPAGTTIQGVRVLEESGFRGSCIDAVNAAYDKTVELGKKST